VKKGARRSLGRRMERSPPGLLQLIEVGKANIHNADHLLYQSTSHDRLNIDNLKTRDGGKRGKKRGWKIEEKKASKFG